MSAEVRVRKEALTVSLHSAGAREPEPLTVADLRALCQMAWQQGISGETLIDVIVDGSEAYIDTCHLTISARKSNLL